MKHKYYIERKGGSKSLYPLYRSEDLTKLNRAFFDAVNKGVLAPVSFQITMSYKTREKTPILVRPTVIVLFVSLGGLWNSKVSNLES